MKKHLKSILFATAILFSSTNAFAQVEITLPENEKISVGNSPVKVTNNNKVLSKKGVGSLVYSNLTDMRVTKDTVFITVKADALKRLDKDNSNYQANRPARQNKKK